MTHAQMDLYKEHGVNPLGGCLPTLVQFPIWIGLYQSIYQVMATSPLQVLQLSKNIYPNFPALAQLIPLDDRFLWLNLGRPDPYYILPVLVAVSMFFQQKLMTMPTGDPSSQSMTKSMTYTMPLMFGFFSLSFSSGLSIYFVVSSLVGIAMQYGLNKYLGLGPGVSDAVLGPYGSGNMIGLSPGSQPTKAKTARPRQASGPLPAATVDASVEEPEGDSSEAAASEMREKGKRRRARKKKR